MDFLRLCCPYIACSIGKSSLLRKDWLQIAGCQVSHTHTHTNMTPQILITRHSTNSNFMKRKMACKKYDKSFTSQNLEGGRGLESWCGKRKCFFFFDNDGFTCILFFFFSIYRLKIWYVESLLPDLGLQQHRLDGDEYVAVIDEFMNAVFTRWPNVIVQVI